MPASALQLAMRWGLQLGSAQGSTCSRKSAGMLFAVTPCLQIACAFDVWLCKHPLSPGFRCLATHGLFMDPSFVVLMTMCACFVLLYDSACALGLRWQCLHHDGVPMPVLAHLVRVSWVKAQVHFWATRAAEILTGPGTGQASFQATTRISCEQRQRQLNKFAMWFCSGNLS